MSEAKQPEALRLADSMARCEPVDFDGDFGKAAAELRRLHALNAELLEALQRVELYASGYIPAAREEIGIEHIRAAIAKATGSAT